MNVNFVMIRHGYGCHNAIRNLYRNDVIPTTENMETLNIYSDPELTPMGVDVSIENGKIVSDILKNLDINKINIVGCSPLIRSMETAYFMSRKWKTPPKKIYVFPFLREIDEHSNNKYSIKSRKVIDTTPSYSMKTLQQQKSYLSEAGLLDYFDFSFVEHNLEDRKEPGDIKRFITWFTQNYLHNIPHFHKNVNVFIVTHAGVLKDYSNIGFYNNSGFILNTYIDIKNKAIDYKNIVSLNDYLQPSFFKDYSNPKYGNINRFCPSNRCGLLCKKYS
jgi:broad specificity phosphatase PhoE